MESFKPSGDKDTDHETLRKLTYDFQQIGMVPVKAKNQISTRFTKATANVAKQLNIGSKELKSTFGLKKSKLINRFVYFSKSYIFSNINNDYCCI